VLHDFDGKTADATCGRYAYATSVNSRTKGGPCQDLWNCYAKRMLTQIS